MFQFKQMTILKRFVLLLLSLGFICSVIGILQIEIKNSVPQYESLDDFIMQMKNNEEPPKHENTSNAEQINSGEHSHHDEQMNSGEYSTDRERGEHTKTDDEEFKININTASAEQLQQLKGIGPSKAAAIVAERDRGGPFKSIEDIKRVKGIGDKTYEAIKESLVN